MTDMLFMRVTRIGIRPINTFIPQDPAGFIILSFSINIVGRVEFRLNP
jgi:hypothetical protein